MPFFRPALILLLSAGVRVSACDFSADCSGLECEMEIAACNWQYDVDSYSDSGIPCGTVYSYDVPCPTGGAPIAGPLSGYSFDAVEAYQAEVQALLPIGENNKAVVPDDQQGAFLMGEGQCINATFIDEGACFLNKVGMITWEASLVPGKGPEDYTAADRETVLENANITVFFPNADSIFCNDAADVDCLSDPLKPFCTSTDPYLPLGTTVQLPPYPGADTFDFPVGVYVGFFIVVDGFPGVSKTTSETLSLGANFHFTTTQLNVATENGPMNDVVSIVEHGEFSVDIMGEEFDFSDFVLLAFEDKINQDYQDVIILLDFKIPVTLTDPPTGGPCEGGTLNSCGDICCDPRCETCGGCGEDCKMVGIYAELIAGSGGPIDCCPESIRADGFECSAAVPYGCVIGGVEPCIDGVCDDAPSEAPSAYPSPM